MSNVLENFFSSRLPIVGLVAYSVEVSDQVLAAQCLSKSLYRSAAEHLLAGVVRSGRTLLPAGQNAARYCWVFECLRVYVATREDGACLSLLVENNPGVQILRIQETLQAFSDLPSL